MHNDEKVYVLALVYRHIKENTEYMSYVHPYTVRRPGIETRITIGGHYRYKAMYRMILAALRCTCKFEDLTIDDRNRSSPTA